MRSSLSKPLISVIIPTFNRADLLIRSLESLVNQSLPDDQFEVVVIDDGSSDHTEDLCRNFEKRLHIRYQRQQNSGIAAAKNMGIFISTGQLLLFFDDDDVADKDMLKEHLKTHTHHPEENIAVLGHTTWHPSLTKTHVMNFVTNIGHFLFSYGNLKQGQILDFTYFWGGRSSCKKSLLVKHGIFNQIFRFGSEDIELGYRLSKFGLKVIYNEKAKSFMIRHLTYEQFCQRCIKQGRSQYHFSKMHEDPVIQDYCMMDRVYEKWEYVRRSLESRIQRVKNLESILEKHKSLSKEQVQEMGNLYWWTFNALKIKGIIEEKESDEGFSLIKEKIEDSRSISVFVKDREYLIKRWNKHNFMTNNRGNVLIVDPFLPMFDRASGSLRLFEIVKSLIRMGFRVTYISRHGEYAEKYVPLLQDMGVEVYPGDPMAIQEIGLNVIGPYLDIEKILRSKRYDYVILSFWHIAEYYLPIVRQYSPGSHIIVDTVDIHFLREFREAEIKEDRSLFAAAEKNKERELSIYQKADRLWVVTKEDRKVIEGIVSPPIDVIPNIHKKIEWEKEFDLTSDLLFVGNFSHRPNIDAVLFFYKRIYPLIRKYLPDVKTYIAGNNPPKEVSRLNSDHFIITGYVEDLSTYLMNIRISVNPLTYGAGMKGKIGEALSWGIPVVTTTIGAEGMHLKDNEDALIADNPNDFARKVIELYNDRTRWEKLSRNGKRLVESRWSPNAVQKRIDSSLLHIQTFDKDQNSAVLMSAIGDRDESDSFEPFSSLGKIANEVSLQSPQRNGQTLVSEKSGNKPALTSIIILCFNQLEYTKKCLQSIEKYTSVPYELILVDNGSIDGTKDFLKNFAGKHPSCTLILNEDNRGFAGGNNQGIAAAKGDYIMLLNNDVVVTEQWLERLIAHIESDENIGMAGPVSNSVSGPQKVAHVPYGRDLNKMQKFALLHSNKNASRTQAANRLVGFCLLIKRQVLDIIGGLDENYGNGNYEDDDLCLRSRIAGFRNIIALDVFIHHYGSMTFKGSSIDYTAGMEGNRKRFAKKWKGIVELIDDVVYKVNMTGEAQLNKLIQWGEERFSEGNFRSAIKIFERVLILDPANSQAINNLGVMQWQLGDPIAAMRTFQNALSNNPKDIDALGNLVQTTMETGRFDLMDPDLLEILNKVHPEYPDLETLINGSIIHQDRVTA